MLSRSLFLLMNCAACAISVTAGGLTIVTHGHRGDTDGWVDAMASAIAVRSLPPSGAAVSVWNVEISGDPPAVSRVTPLRGPTPTAPDWNGEIVVLLDWRTLAEFVGPHPSTELVAGAFYDWVMSVSPGDTAWVGLPIHLIGHSRGASLMAALSRRFENSGIWIDHLTLLDPHPVDGVREDCRLFFDEDGEDFGDAPTENTPANVVFAEDYWREDSEPDLDCLPCDPDGESTTGALSVQLTESVLSAAGYLNEHSDVHLWYHGTIDLAGTGDGERIGCGFNEYASLDPTWYAYVDNARGPRESVGFKWSRIARGQPWTSPARDGYHIALAGNGSRPLWNWPPASAVWPNVLRPRVLNGSSFAPGDQIQLEVYYWDYSGGASIQFFLDQDENPFNGFGTALGTTQTANATPNGPASWYPTFTLAASPTGTRYVVARIFDGALTRYEYAVDSISICMDDVDGDRDVDLTDLTILLSHFGTLSGASRGDGDLDGDEDVDLTDLTLLLAHFGDFCPDAPAVGMVFVPGGSFNMGDSFNEGNPVEQPVHLVYLSSYSIDRFEVTNARYAAALNWAYAQGNLISVSGAVVYKYNSGTNYPYCDTTSSDPNSRITWNGSTFGAVAGKSDHPVVQVTWYGAAAYSNWRSAMEGRQPCFDTGTWNCDFTRNGYRLPTEAEWEKASGWDPILQQHYRFGEHTDGCGYNCLFGHRANYEASGDAFEIGGPPFTTPVGYYDGTSHGGYPTQDARSYYGCYDMSGNVWEWCYDWYSSTYYSGSPSSNPTGPSSGTVRTLRGGGWTSELQSDCRSAYRGWTIHSRRYPDYGFRCAVGIP